MTSKPLFTDNLEFEAFFQKGDEQSRAGDSLQPFTAIESEVAPETRQVRTPAQRERRARLVKFVSFTMACLTIGSVGATLHVVKARERAAPLLSMLMDRNTENDGSIAANVSLAPQALRNAVPAGRAELGPSDPASRGAITSAAPAIEASAQRAVVSLQVAEPDAVRPEMRGVESSARASNNTSVTGDTHATHRVSGTEEAKAPGATRPLAVVVNPVPRQRNVVVASSRTKSGASSNKPEIPTKPADYRPPTASFAD